MSNEIIYNWNFSNNKNRGKMWYIIAFSVIVGFVIWGFLTSQFIMSFLIILISGVSFFLDNNAKESTNINILNLGIKIDDNFYDYSKIRSYSLLYDKENAIILRLDLLKKGIQILDLKIDNNIAADLKQILPNYIKEDENGELTFTDKIIRLLKL